MAIETSADPSRAAGIASSAAYGTAAATVEAARRGLHAARGALDAEIRAYPTPVAGCDAQFNHLLAERRRVRAALAALEAEIRIPTPRAP